MKSFNIKKKGKMVKIKDLPKDFILDGCKLKGQIIISGWNKGFWVKNDEKSSQVFPVFFKNWDEIKDWKLEIPPEKVLFLTFKNHENK